MNRMIMGMSILIFIIPNWFVVDWLFNNLDYCVTHICGITHNFGLQDIIWMVYPTVSMLLIICTGVYLVYGYLRKFEGYK